MLRWWALAFALTLLLEVPVYVWALRRSVATRRAVVAAVVVNVATHPAVFAIAFGGSVAAFVGAELGAWFVEALLIWVLTGRARALREMVLVAFVANALSAGVGLLIG